MPPELLGAIILFVVTALAGGTLIVRAASKYIASRFEIESERQRIQLDDLKRESAENAANSKIVLENYNRMSAALIEQGKMIAGLQADKESTTRQLEESRKTNKTRDEQLGELRALLAKTASERDQEKLLREKLEAERNAALEQIKVMEQEIKDLTSRVAYLENKLRDTQQIPTPSEVKSE